MGRTKISPIQQPDDTTCGPASLKLALQILGKRKSLDTLSELCKTNTNGTSTMNMIKAINKLGFSVMLVEYATLKHLQSVLKYRPDKVRAALVSYLYDHDEKLNLDPYSGHWAVVSSFKTNTSRIVLLDSSSGRKKSYKWIEFRERWRDFDLRRHKVNGKTNGGRQFKLVKRWQPQLLMIIARDPKHFPKFTIPTKRIYLPGTYLAS